MDQTQPNEQFVEIVGFLWQNRESRDEALNIILSFTGDYDQRVQWKGTELDKHLLRVLADCIDDEALTVKAIQALVNLANDKAWIESLCELNVARRIFEFLMHNVKPSASSIRTENATIVKVQMTEEGGTTDVYELKQGQGNSIQFAVMLLSNIAMSESGQEHMLGTDKKTRGSIIENLCGMFTYFRSSEMFDFVSNILANVSSLKAGRQWMIENSKNVLSPLFLLLQDPELSKHRVKHLVETLRNVLFEWEKYEKEFVQMEVVELCCRFLVKEHGLTENSLPDSWERMKGIAKKEKFTKDIEVKNSKNLLDSLMLLSNSDTFLKIMEEKKIGELLAVLKVAPFGESRDCIDVIVTKIGMLALPADNQMGLEVEQDDLD